MSIPPLVCSTPPPPDQCEDDKDQDEYELQYNLSQEDDERNDYDFGNYPTYNFQTPAFSKQEDIPTNNIKHEDCEENDVVTDKISLSSDRDNDERDNITRSPDTNRNKLGTDDDYDIEDLNLKIESSSSSVKDSSSGDEISKTENFVDVNSLHVPNTSSSESQDEIENTPTLHSEPEVFEPFECQTIKVELTEKEIFKGNSKDIGEDNDISQIFCDEMIENEMVETDIKKSSDVLEAATDDDFGDFDDLQFTSPEAKSNVVLDSYENPWEDKDTDNSEFGNFTANFDNSEVANQNIISNNNIDEIHSEFKDPDCLNDDDSFGDFDEFQSSIQKELNVLPEKELSNEESVFSLQSTENDVQIMERINKVLSLLFKDEISDNPLIESEPKLESLLSETWGHLTETDIRQPYIINWNSSLGQKTLLKALCIDSRNILFGPKWSHNMPKYAANLSSAPLQPQKQLSNSPQTEVTSSKKTTNKPSNWRDPFSANGQQSCNTEKESNVIEPRPTDLDVFEVALSKKSEKIYSSTINVQPIRQINLPDTHIFTPTDSETPRSKTIHYDNIPSVLIPQTITDKHKHQEQSVTSQSTGNVSNKVEDEDDYWEFQEFKTTTKSDLLTETKSQSEQSTEKSNEIITINNPLPKPSMAYQTQLLQPIKMEPAMPKLNWPDPGEVKEEFDTFSDFASTSSWVDSNPSNSQVDNIRTACNVNINMPENNKKANIGENERNSLNENSLDDDFDTFQSALPSINKTIDFNSDSVRSESSSHALAHNTNHLDYEHSILKENSVKTDTISFGNTVKSNESLQNTLGFMITTTETSTNRNISSMGTQLHMNLLQPTPTGSAPTLTSNQQKSGQILQPLSLESYSQINWPSPGIDLQDLSRFNPVETLHSLKSDLSVSSQSRGSPVHSSKPVMSTQIHEDDVWGEFVSSKPTAQISQTKKQTTFGDDDEWTDFVSSPSVKPHNGLNTISLNVHTNSNMQKTTSQGKFLKNNQISLDIPTLNYITPKTNNHKSYNDRHFQNL